MIFVSILLLLVTLFSPFGMALTVFEDINGMNRVLKTWFAIEMYSSNPFHVLICLVLVFCYSIPCSNGGNQIFYFYNLSETQ